MAIPADKVEAIREGAIREGAIRELVETQTDCLPAAASGVSFREAREFPRFPFRGRARAIVYPLERTAAGSGKGSAKGTAKGNTAAPQECEVLTTDVSRGGLALMHRKQLRPGQQILLMLNETSRRVEVCWCCRVWPGLYTAGCQFIDGEPGEEGTVGEGRASAH